jgi:CheY-like chemotaxis protein/predicted RNA-binding Zn-ribbon protein involved in translation (DUF1610 family)
MYTDVFRQSGFEILEANDGVEGVDMATKNMPDVIFTGIVMPRMDGFTLIETLKKNVLTAKIPVLMSSHLGREEDRKRAQDLGVREFVIRDFTSPMEVVNLVSSIFAEGSEYTLDFDKYNLDAQRLARDLNFNGHFQCTECGESMVLKFQIGEKGMHTAQFVCPKCGWRQV